MAYIHPKDYDSLSFEHSFYLLLKEVEQLEAWSVYNEDTCLDEIVAIRLKLLDLYKLITNKDYEDE